MSIFQRKQKQEKLDLTKDENLVPDEEIRLKLHERLLMKRFVKRMRKLISRFNNLDDEVSNSLRYREKLYKTIMAFGDLFNLQDCEIDDQGNEVWIDVTTQRLQGKTTKELIEYLEELTGEMEKVV